MSPPRSGVGPSERLLEQELLLQLDSVLVVWLGELGEAKGHRRTQLPDSVSSVPAMAITLRKTHFQGIIMLHCGGSETDHAQASSEARPCYDLEPSRQEENSYEAVPYLHA